MKTCLMLYLDTSLLSMCRCYSFIFGYFQVNISVSDNKPLGLMIRGGNEYGLGIYITGVDRGLLADDAGLKVYY